MWCRFFFTSSRFCNSNVTHSSVYTNFNHIKINLGVKGDTPKDWQGITKKEFIENGGKELLLQHKGSLFETLDTLFPNEFWYKSIRLDNKYFDKLENQKKFLKVSKKNNYLAFFSMLIEFFRNLKYIIQ